MVDLLKFKGIVEEVKKQEVLGLYVASIRSEDGKYRVTMDVHEDLKVFDRGDIIEFTVTTKKPRFKLGEDFVGRGIIYVLRSIGGDTVKIQVSIGGLQTTVMCSEKDAPRISSIPMDVYIKVSKI